MATNKNDNRKIFIVGDKGCGKRTLISAFKYDQFIADQVEFRYGDTYVADIPVDGKTVTIDIGIDNSGIARDIRYSNRSNLNRTVNIAIICFSIDDFDSLTNVIEKWIPEIRYFCGQCPVILVACKIDLRTDPEKADEKLVTRETGRRIAAEIRADAYMESSSKTQEGVQDLFIQAARLSFKKRSHRTSCVRCILQ